MHAPGFFPSNDFVTLYAAQDLTELMAVAAALENGLGVWALLRPAETRRQIMLHRGSHSLDPLAAGQVARIQFPVGNHACLPGVSWARSLLQLLRYQYDWAEETTILLPVWEAGELLAVLGIIGQAKAGTLAPASLAMGVGLTIRKLHQLAELRRDVEGAKHLLRHQPKSMVLVGKAGRIMHGTESGLVILQKLRVLNPSHHDRDGVLPAVLQTALEEGTRHLVLGDLKVHFSTLPLDGVTTVTELACIEFSRNLEQKQGSHRNAEQEELTPAEQRVHTLLMRGLRNKEIADQLGCSIHTIKHHVSAVLRKTHSCDRLLLVARAAETTAAVQPLPPLRRVEWPKVSLSAVNSTEAV